MQDQQTGQPEGRLWGRRLFVLSALVSATVLAGAVRTGGRAAAAEPAGGPAMAQAALIEPLLEDYCSRCHNDYDNVAGLSVSDLKASDLAAGRNSEAWEKILRRVAAGEMPPHSRAQPEPAERAALVAWLDASRAAFAAAHPDPGPVTVRRLNRAEYANAVRDLLGIDASEARELPADNSGFGFDNVADVLSVSPTLMERYVALASKFARKATGRYLPRELVTTWQVPKDGSVMNSGIPAWNERSGPDLPLASRGGTAVRYDARFDGEYRIAVWLNANTNNESDRLREDRFAATVPLSAGPHRVAVSFRRQTWPDESVQTLRNTTDYVPLPLDKPQPLALDVWVDGARAKTLEVPSFRVHPRYSQRNFPRDVLQLDIAGPLAPGGAGKTAASRALFVCRPTTAAEEGPCATRIIAGLARRAWRRPVGEGDLAPLVRLYAAQRATPGPGADFAGGIEAAVAAILVSPQFLFVVETPPAAARPGQVYPLPDLALATRLALFLWSSLPDERLLGLAEAGRLRAPGVLDGEIARMLADPRAAALTDNFAGQWLYLRNLDQQRPDSDVFPGFDVQLRSAMASESRLFFAHVLRANRPVTDFLQADYTFLNQRLADHYGIPGISGTAFRLVKLPPGSPRGGLLGQASVLTVTSYGNRTSVVKRGKWILDNLLASPPAPPPADVPALKAEHDGRLLTARQQLELHRANPACASCHARMDPLGFALENFDAVGAWRTSDAGQPIDPAADLPDGRRIVGVAGLQRALLERRDAFVEALTERLMTYALARGLRPEDGPAVRAIGRAAAADGYRMQAIVRGIVASPAFAMGRLPATGSIPHTGVVR